MASAIAAGVALVLTVSAMGGEAAPAADTEQRATERAEAGAEGRAAEEHLGPVYVRSFKPMRTSPIRLWERHGPVYFRSPFAEPTASDRDVDRCIPLAAGAAVADWAIFAARVLGFPVEPAIAPPWQTEPLGR